LIKVKISGCGHHLLWSHHTGDLTEKILHPTTLRVCDGPFRGYHELLMIHGGHQAVVVGHQNHFIPVFPDPALYIADDVRRINRQNLLERKQVVKILYGTNRDSFAVETVQFLYDMADNTDILTEPDIVVGIAAKGVIKIDMETKSDVDFMGCFGRRGRGSKSTGEPYHPYPNDDQEQENLLF
jgi:hypothetical protein